jgi:Zn-dependent protease
VLEINLGAYPIRISFSFVILPVIFALNLGVAAMVIMGLALFVSVLLHEFGHAWTVRRFGGQVANITLHAMGGVTLWADPSGRIEGIRRVAVSAAGSGIQIPTALLAWVLVDRGVFGSMADLLITSPWDVDAISRAALRGEWVVLFLAAFIWVGFVFGLFNWIPIGGLDGFHMLEVGLVGFLGPQGRTHAAIASLILGGAVAYVSAQLGFDLLPIFVLFLAAQPLLSLRR